MHKNLCLHVLLSTSLIGAAVALAADQPAAAPQTKCPVSGTPIDRSVHVDYQGQRIYFCCAKCPAEFRRTPRSTSPLSKGRASSSRTSRLRARSVARSWARTTWANPSPSVTRAALSSSAARCASRSSKRTRQSTSPRCPANRAPQGSARQSQSRGPLTAIGLASRFPALSVDSEDLLPATVPLRTAVSKGCRTLARWPADFGLVRPGSWSARSRSGREARP